MAELAERPPSLVEIAKPDLEVVPSPDELVEVIQRECEAVIAAGVSVVEHAIKAGEALLHAKRVVERGKWEAWLGQNFPTYNVATLRTYMRVAKHQEQVRLSGANTIKTAERALVGQAIRPHEDELKAEARRIRRTEGLSYDAIADRLGVSRFAVQTWINPGIATKRRKRRRQQSRNARRALHRHERDVAAKKAGGSIAESYALVRKALVSLEEAQYTEADAEAKTEISVAIERLHAAEDHIVRASKLSAGSKEQK